MRVVVLVFVRVVVLVCVFVRATEREGGERIQTKEFAWEREVKQQEGVVVCACVFVVVFVRVFVVVFVVRIVRE